jgi:acyl-CoA synthetase (AMP-forming)/AMP-acid ligase II
VWRQQNVLAALDGMLAAMKLSGEDCCLNWTPLYHDMGLVNNFLLCMTSGVPLVMLQPHDFVRKPARWLQSLHDTGATLTWSPNFGFAISAQRIRDRELQGVRLDNVRAFWNAAERIHEETMREFSNRFTSFGLQPTALKTNFGCAENVGGATFSPPDQGYLVEYVDRERFHQERLAVPVDPVRVSDALPFVSCGRPYPGMTVHILSDSGEPLPEGHVGEVALDTPSRMEEYLLDPDSTAQARQGDLLLTGDLGYVRGQEFYWVGRSRERIAVRGKKVDPSDFEAVMHNVSGLRHGSFAAFGVDDPEQGTQRVVIVAEVRDPMAAQDGLGQISMDIRDQTLKHLGLNVSEILLVPANTLTKTSSGKRRHRYFRQLYEEGQLQKHSLLVPS